MTNFFLYLSVCIILGIIKINTNEIVGDYKFDIFNENGSYYLEKNYNESLLWIQFNSIIKSSKSFWLKIKRKKMNEFPVLVKSQNRNSYNLSTLPKSTALCHFSAVSHLLTHRHLIDEFSLDDDNDDDRQYQPISLCHGLSGIVTLPDNKNLVKIEPTKNGNIKTVHLTKIPKLSSDYLQQMEEHPQLKNIADGVVRQRHKRVKRAFNLPVQNMAGPFLVELYLVVDSKMANMYQRNGYSELLSRIKSIMNQINVAFMEFNIYFIVVQLEIWEYDQIRLTDENHILMELQLYKRQFVEKKHDCLHAILGENLGNARRGQSELAAMCAFSRCVGYTKDYWGLNVQEIAHAAMHELGHNFGLSHDTERCHCYGCIMATGVEFGNRKFQWSNCSKKEITGLLNSGMSDCLRDRPLSKLMDSKPIIMSQNRESRSLEEFSFTMCGNGVVDEGEECDCGGSECSVAAKRCCQPETCRLRSFAYCASGACCDQSTCSIKNAGTICRLEAHRDCDLPEYCDGSAEWCPVNVFQYDGLPCKTASVRDWSHCYKGECHSRMSWCKVLYGDSGNEANARCYKMNKIGTEVENCGLQIPIKGDRMSQPKNWKNIPCDDDNWMCGRLWCSHENERVLRSSPQFEVDKMVEGNHCSAARFYLDWFLDDAGLVPNGSPCGYGKMCWRGTCIHSVYNDMGGCYCHGHGVCNNRGNCHCDAGFAPPNCTSLGNGGSLDSGPPVGFNKNLRFIIAGILIFLVVIFTTFTIVILLYHYNTRRWPPILLKLKWPKYHKPDSMIESKEPVKFENHHSKINSAHPGQLSLIHETKYQVKNNHQSPLCSPTSPIIIDETIYANIPPPAYVHKSSPPLKNNLNKPSTVKSKALLFEKVPQKSTPNLQNSQLKTQNLILKDSSKVFDKKDKPLITTSKPIKESTNLNQASLQSNKPPLLTSKPGKPTLLSSKPDKPTLISSKSDKPTLQSSKPDKPTLQGSNPGKLKLLNSKPENPPLLSSKPGKPPLKSVKPEIVKKPTPFTDQPPVLVDNKPQKSVIVQKPDIIAPKPLSGLTESDIKTDSRIVHLSTKPKTTKEQISQPRLDQTTCTAKTCDLPSTDQTLSRTVAPHKVLRLDHKAVKYSY